MAPTAVSQSSVMIHVGEFCLGCTKSVARARARLELGIGLRLGVVGLGIRLGLLIAAKAVVLVSFQARVVPSTLSLPLKYSEV